MRKSIKSTTAFAAAASLIVALAGCSGGGAMQTTPQAQSPAATGAALQSPAAVFKTVHVFSRAHGSSDGTNPPSDLLDLEGQLYGTTNAGGANDQGAVFAITPAGDEKIVYSFRGGSDGKIPYAGAIAVNGTLYGTTYYGGAAKCQVFYVGCGIVYSLSPSGTEKVLHRFVGVADGAFPEAALTSVNGVLYGTTYAGGKSKCSNGCGTVFAITPGGAEKVLHAFSGGNDGAEPYAGLIAVKGVLYGTTSIGGGSGCTYQEGCGTVFEITPSGTEKVLYAFAGGIDGEQPAASLIAVNDVLYGTTLFGGGKKGSCGTVFSLTLAGTKQKLHTFDQTDGCAPSAKLIDVNGTLYGTTQGWGSDHGTLFSISMSGTFKKLYSLPGGAGGNSSAGGAHE